MQRNTPETVMINGAEVWPEATSLSPTNEGVYSWWVTLSFQTMRGQTGHAARHGLIVPGPDSTYAGMRADLVNWTIGQITADVVPGTAVLEFYECRPNAL